MRLIKFSAQRLLFELIGALLLLQEPLLPLEEQALLFGLLPSQAGF
jgi:hypothetical protein